MNSTLSTTIKVVLFLAIVYLAYLLYTIIQEPIQFEKLKEKRYDAVKERLENIRDAQKAYRDVYNVFAKEMDQLIAFVDTGKKPIIQRKDSTFMYYNEVYQQEMEKDTIITTILGYERVKTSLFDKNFQPAKLKTIPYSGGRNFEMKAGKINVNNVIIPVFEAKAPNTAIFHDVLDKYDQYIDEEDYLSVGSLTEPTLSGNWK